MCRKYLIIFINLLLCLLVFSAPAQAIETAPHISDREIVESLSELKAGQKAQNARFEAIDKRFEIMDKRFDDLRTDMNSRFGDLRADMNARFDTITWILGLFISISTIILGFVIRMQWQMNRQQARLEKALEAQETAIETQKDELDFIKGLVEKLISPKGVL